MADQGHEYAEERIAEFQAEVADVYRQAEETARKRLERHLERFEEKDEEKRQQVADGEMTEQAYADWRRMQMMTGKRYEQVLQQVADAYANANQVAVDAINGKLPEVYAENANFGGWQVCEASGLDVSFSLMDAGTAQHMLTAGEAMFAAPALDVAKDVAWNRKLMASQLSQGVLLGESIPKLAKRMERVTGSNWATALRTARTAVTGAENAGRVDSYKRAQAMGIKLEQEWLATLDNRTRHTHRQLDGERREVGEKFSNGCRFPGDPQARYAEVCNCRCTLVAAIDGIDQSDAERWSKLPEGMTYEQWKGAKAPKSGEKAKLGLGLDGDARNSMRKIGVVNVTEPDALGFCVERIKAEIRNESVEHAIVIQRDGTVMRGSGNSSSVSLDGSIVKDAVVIHNHPTKPGEHIAFGADDYSVLVGLEPRTLIAVDSEYDYTLERGSVEPVSYNEAYRNGLDPFGDEDQQHNIMRWLNDNGYVKYSREAIHSGRGAGL